MEGASKECGVWSEDAVRILIDSYTAKFVELQRSNLRQKDWQDILARLSSSCGEGYSYARCRNKLDALKKKFKIIKSKRELGSGSKGGTGAKWKWYDHMEKLMDRSSGSGGARGIPGGIASGEKLGPLAAADDATDDDVEVGAANSGDEEEVDEGEEEEDDDDDEEAEEAQEEDEGMPPSSFLFDLRPGFLDSGLNLTLNGICAAAATAAAGSADFRSPPSLPKFSDKTIRKQHHRASPLNRHATEVVAMLIQAVERIEKNRLEFEEKKLELMRDIDLKRNETNLEIAKCIIDSCMSKSFSF
ncbi:trihelix transcription factor ASIL1-like [Selaginella moellendorffii]|uniref:trihelix transcription factor ASIL1-like n=1 Tax=Selaginella moellendorffii TaxID=88036 RepID=UPI000D1C97DD|nr:trihelix transcription factor ASIL1-like [Selaginella moellendorffii]|eukprot:XP_024524447.1 trihelix transcription factor ASIL1-like [Selaginella moellendorffii]